MPGVIQTEVETRPLLTVEEPCYTEDTVMEKHSENMSYLLHMIAVLRERQSSWQLTENERQLTKKGIEALEAAKDALSTQIYA